MNTVNLNRKKYLNYIITLILTLVVFFALDSFSETIRVGVSAIAAFVFEWIGSRIIYKDKVVLNFSNSAMDKDTKFYLIENNKRIDMIKIRSRYDDHKTSDEDHVINAKEQLQAMLLKHMDIIKSHKNLFLVNASNEEEQLIKNIAIKKKLSI